MRLTRRHFLSAGGAVAAAAGLAPLLGANRARAAQAQAYPYTLTDAESVSYTHLTLPTICSV